MAENVYAQQCVRGCESLVEIGVEMLYSAGTGQIWGALLK